MAIGNNKADINLRRTRLLFEAVAWQEFFTTATKNDIVKILQKRLLTKGTNSKGDIIGLYSLATEFISNGKKEQGEPFTLFDTGDFYASMFVVVFRDSFMIEADGQKDDGNLFEKYGENITGLTNENLQIIKTKLQAHYINYAKKVLLVN